MSNQDLLTGGHVSAAGGLYKAIENATELGANAIQFFGASPRQWMVKMPSESDVEKYKIALKESNVRAVYLHAAYLPNLATADADTFEKSIKSLSEHLQIVTMIGAEGLIFHMGSCGAGMTREQAVEQTARGMKEVLKRVPGGAFLIMENSSGGGKKLGEAASEIGTIKRLVGSKRVKVCLDTAHAFESGMIDPRPENKDIKTQVKAVFDEWDKEIGLENMVAIHTNDSKTEFGSHADRHENLGSGAIGLAGLRALASEPRLRHAAWIMEVPGFDGEGSDRENLAILRKCFGK